VRGHDPEQPQMVSGGHRVAEQSQRVEGESVKVNGTEKGTQFHKVRGSQKHIDMGSISLRGLKAHA